MRRRSFITLLGGAAAIPALLRPRVVHAQQGDRMWRIGVLMGFAEDDPETQERLATFRMTLQRLGWTDGRNVRFDVRWSGGDADLIKTYAAELVRLAPDAILVHTQSAVTALSQETRTIPIVFAQILDPVGFGLVASLSHPGANITGFTSFEYSIVGKWIELVMEVAPRVTWVAILHDRRDPAAAGFLRACETVAPALGVALRPITISRADDIESGIEAFVREGGGALIVQPTAIVTANRKLVIAAASRYRLPATYPYRYWPTSGGLMSYGFDNIDQYRGAATYVDRILKGTKPSDLPVQAPTRFQLVVNLKTAKAIGLTIPETFLLRADEVIE